MFIHMYDSCMYVASIIGMGRNWVPNDWRVDINPRGLESLTLWLWVNNGLTMVNHGMIMG